MRKCLLVALILLLCLGLPSVGRGLEIRVQGMESSTLPRALEIELALSALPPHLRADATVYVLGQSGRFEVGQLGSNGFHTLVSRQDPNAFLGDWVYSEYRDDILVPIAFDEAGASTILPVYFDMADLRASGVTPQELKDLVRSRFENGYYKAPKRTGISYMLAPVFRTYFNPEKNGEIRTMNVPHYMFYAPGVSNEEIGGKFQSAHPFMLTQTRGPHGYIIQIVGASEREAINHGYSRMIASLCEVRDLYCLPSGGLE